MPEHNLRRVVLGLKQAALDFRAYLGKDRIRAERETARLERAMRKLKAEADKALRAAERDARDLRG